MFIYLIFFFLNRDRVKEAGKSNNSRQRKEGFGDEKKKEASPSLVGPINSDFCVGDGGDTMRSCRGVR